MTVKLICVGKIKRPFLTDACAHYKKMLSRFCKCEIIECEDDAILSAAKTCGYVIALDAAGLKMDSPAFAKKLMDISLTASTIGFIVGGSTGLMENVLKSADLRLSFSDMTFPHQFFRVMLLEQVYRAFTINEGHPYHK